MSTQITVAATSIRRGRLSPRLLWLVPGIAVAIYAGRQAEDHGMGLLGLATLLAFGIVPHLPVLLGLGRPHARGQMPTRAVPLFNATHHPVGPLALLVLSGVGILSPLWLVGGLAWLGHLVVDLALGDGLRTRDGWRRAWWSR